MIKKIVVLTVALGFMNSCVLVRFPNEINIRLDFPEHMSTGDIDHVIQGFPSRIAHPKGSMRVNVFKDKDSIKYGAKEFLFISDEGRVVHKNDSIIVRVKEN